MQGAFLSAGISKDGRGASERIHGSCTAGKRGQLPLYRIWKVILFGSLLTDAPKVGDIDLAVGLEPKEPVRTKGVDVELARGQEAARNGMQFSNFIEVLYFTERVRLFLTGRSRIIQMTDLDDGVQKTANSRVIYEYVKQ